MGFQQQQQHKTSASSMSKFVFFLVGLSVGITSCFYILSFYYVTNQNQLLACTTSSSSSSPVSVTHVLASLSTPSPPSSQLPSPPPPPPPPPPSLPPPDDVESGETLLHHIEDDTELLWRASLVPQIPEYPFQRVPKIAFLFLTRGPLPLAPLWEMFFLGHEDKYSIYIHTHPNYTDPMPKDSVFHGRRIPSKTVEWANISMIDAERRLLASALLDYSNEKFILLSEACIPLYNFTTIYDYLVIKTNLSFVGVEPDPKKASPYRWRGKMNPPLQKWQWQKGAQWVVMDRVLSVDILSDTKYYPVFRDHCSWPCQNQDEHYVQILVMLHHPERNSNRCLTWTEWKGHRHPTMFGPRSNISVDLIQRMRFRDNCTIAGQFTNMCYLFARKFAPNSIKQLLEMSSTLFG
ncbi:glycosyltransferase BC10 [Beta vulgaris subsp. vulgaris]|uniref:glycosyltransferase BC10 n=1 Tax=Beta vulgaris subsp. vulgaris TaxID=3555 RepID=UPI0020369991|nr:glycosyltransferase BC10 [Beta vulgaris subsp. vulgaris]